MELVTLSKLEALKFQKFPRGQPNRECLEQHLDKISKKNSKNINPPILTIEILIIEILII